MGDTHRFELLASGYGLVEGPTLAPDGGLYYSDVLGGGVFQLASSGSITTVVPKRRGVGGIAAHADGGVVCSGRDLIHVRDGVTRTLFAIDGLPGWNDLCTDARGQVYAGAVRFRVFDRGVTVVPGECWRIDGPDSASELYADVSHANLVHICAATIDHQMIGVSWLPQYHDMGLIGYYLFPLLVGGTTYGFSPLKLKP